MDENAQETKCDCGCPAKCGWLIAVVAVVGGFAIFFGMMTWYFGRVDKPAPPMPGMAVPPAAAAKKPAAPIEMTWVKPNSPPGQDDRAAEAEARAIAEQALVYGFPLVVNYGTLYDFNVDKRRRSTKAPSTASSAKPASSPPRTRRSSPRTATRPIRCCRWTSARSRWC